MFLRELRISDHSKGSNCLKNPKECITIYDNYLNLNCFNLFVVLRGEISIKEPIICIPVKDTNIKLKRFYNRNNCKMWFSEHLDSVFILLIVNVIAFKFAGRFFGNQKPEL